MSQQLGVKDDRSLFEMLHREREKRRALGLSDEPEETGAPRTVKAEWERMQQARTAPGTYYIAIEYRDRAYHAHALTFPEVTAQGETVEAVRERVAEALRVHFAGLRAGGEAVPIREHRRVETVEVSLEDVQQAKPAVVVTENAASTPQ